MAKERDYWERFYKKVVALDPETPFGTLLKTYDQGKETMLYTVVDMLNEEFKRRGWAHD